MKSSSHAHAPARELAVSVYSKGNMFRVEAENIAITFETNGPVPPRASQIQTFAAWAALPLGMALNRNIIIHEVGDQETERNAEQLSRIWAAWMPEKFRPVSLRFDSHAAPGLRDVDSDVVFYSGGVDSTFNLLQRRREKKQHTLLTIHGLDYKTPDVTRFNELLEKTRPFAQYVGGERIFARTNIYEEYKKLRVYPDIGHGFALAASVFLWDGAFPRAELAADYALHEQFITHPWGTNSATNPYFRSAGLRIITAQDHVTRAESVSEK